jgi:hypothetical protein
MSGAPVSDELNPVQQVAAQWLARLQSIICTIGDPVDRSHAELAQLLGVQLAGSSGQIRADLHLEAMRIAFLIAGDSRLDEAATSLTIPIFRGIRSLSGLGRQLRREARQTSRVLRQQESGYLDTLRENASGRLPEGAPAELTAALDLLSNRTRANVQDSFRDIQRLAIIVRATGLKARIQAAPMALQWITGFWALKLIAFTLTAVGVSQGLRLIFSSIGWASIPLSAAVGAIVVQLGLVPFLRSRLAARFARHVETLFGTLVGLRFQGPIHAMAIQALVGLAGPPHSHAPPGSPGRTVPDA